MLLMKTIMTERIDIIMKKLKDSDTIMRYFDFKKFDDLLKSGQIYMNGLLNFHNENGDLLV